MSKMEWSIVEPNDFFATKDEYNIEGKKYVRVTRSLNIISKPGLLVWWQSVGKKRANEIIKERQVLGTKVHKLIELNLKNKKYNIEAYEKEIRDALEMFIKFKKEAKLEPQALEQHLWSNEYGYAGTADYLGNYTTPEKYLMRGYKAKFSKGAFVIGDWKTSKSIYPEYALQLAAYAHAFYELTGKKVDGGVIIQIRFGRVKIKEWTWDELMELFEVYKSAVELYKWKYKKGKWKK